MMIDQILTVLMRMVIEVVLEGEEVVEAREGLGNMILNEDLEEIEGVEEFALVSPRSSTKP